MSSLSLTPNLEPQRVFPKEKFLESLLESKGKLSQKQIEAVQIFCENHLDTYIKQGADKIRAGTGFTHGSTSYTLPRTIEIVTDPATRKKMAFLALNKGMSVRKQHPQKDRLVGDGASKRAKCALSLENGSLASRLTFEDTPKARAEIEFLLKQGEKLECLPVLGVLHFTSKHSTNARNQRLAKKPDKIALYQPLAKHGDIQIACTKGVFNRLTLPQQLYLCEIALKRLGAIHQNNLVHCDIRPENILIHEERELDSRIIDFEYSKPPGEYDRAKDPECGQLAYLSPELLSAVSNQTYRNDPARDMWSIAMSLHRILYGSSSYINPRYEQAVGLKRASAMLGVIATRKEAGEPSLLDKCAVSKTPDGQMDKSTLAYFFWNLLQFEPKDRMNATQAYEAMRAMRIAAEKRLAPKEDGKEPPKP